MSETPASLNRKITSATDLESVVRTMKAVAASSISQYESAVSSLDDYYRTVQLGLAACFKDRASAGGQDMHKEGGTIGAIVFGSDQGLVGQFNDLLVEFVIDTLDKLPGKKKVWAVGERIQSRLTDSDLPLGQSFTLPTSINEITPLISHVLLEMQARREQGEITQVYLFHNRPKSGSIYEPASLRLLPLDHTWQSNLAAMPWPSNNLPEVINGVQHTLPALIAEYLFVSLFRACAESLASENASRLAAMQRAEKNIGEQLEDLNRDFHRLRQSAIDEELFDVVSGFEALGKP
ncbi:MAG TPA: F0F1 ATP synthase subunit gamma [Pseudomonas sp.]|uniref:F0F1 ATP synthase subunit gamma n=1 Tax=Pseudomonas sp. TaxID=306 RepID=UPI002EDA367A